MSIDNYITLNQLKKTTEALLIKINEDGDSKVSKTSVQAALSQGVKIATIGDIDLYAPYSMNQEQVWQAIQDYLTYNYSSLIVANLTNSNGSYRLDRTYNQLLSLLFGQHVFVIVKTFNVDGYYDNGEFVVQSSGSGPILYPNYHADDGILLFSCVSEGTYYCLQITSSGEISYSQNSVSEKADWEQTNQYDKSYILNKPAIKAGDGQNSIVENSIEEDSTTIQYKLLISGAANATTYTYTTEDTLPSNAYNLIDKIIYAPFAAVYKFLHIQDIDLTNNTITFNFSLSTTAIENQQITIFYNQKQALSLGEFSHTQGYGSITGRKSSHAEGNKTIAGGLYSHAQGTDTLAFGGGSHAEGFKTRAYGFYSHTEGSGTIANSGYQHVFGRYNIKDPSTNAAASGTYIQIVGNGSSNTSRSNARTLDWSGNEILSGKLTVGADPTAAMDVVTKQYFETNVNTLIQTALAEYGDGDTASYGYPSVNGVEF